MGAESEGRRYRAFISYSHRDAVFGRRLHRRLEAYALPKRLVGRPTPTGPAPARLAPIFRDREELAAAHDLTEEVRAALRASDSLVVVCSPAAAASPWVAREVDLFRELHPDRPILAALIQGEPAEAFPPPMRRDGSVEPLAADFRTGADGDRLALLKLVAGIVGIGLDQLVQRDAQRRLRRVTAVTAVAVSAMLAMGVLTAFALSARAEAERQRGEAEGIIEFMLTDLRDKLKGVGRLDIMGAVNERALHYYTNQDLSRLPASSLERRARLLHAMGENDETRGDHMAALAKFSEARRTTATLLAQAPNDQDRIFDQAQNEFWIGYVSYQRGETRTAALHFHAYKSLADRLVKLAPGNPQFLKEAGYAEGNLCSIAMQAPRDLREALRSCSSALEQINRAASRMVRDDSIQRDLANRHALLANAYIISGELTRAQFERLTEDRTLSELLQRDPKNIETKKLWLSLQRALADLDRRNGHASDAQSRLRRTLKEIDRLIAFEPNDDELKSQRNNIINDLNSSTHHQGK